MAGARCFCIPSRSPTLLMKPFRVSRRASSWSCSSQLSALPSLTSKTVQINGHESLPFDHHTMLASQAGQCTKTLEEMQEGTHKTLQKSCDPTATLMLIDTIQRLGISHNFEENIKVQLERFSECDADDNLFVTALRFRLLRQRGLPVCSDVFNKFINKNGKFKQSLREDIMGIMSLYEASYLGTKTEDILFQAMEFTTTHLTNSMPAMATQFRKRIAGALELPRHLRMARLEARNYFDECSRASSHDLNLLQLAKFEFNTVQSLHQRELSEILRWWKELGLVDKLSFARDRPLECFLWTIGIFPEPKHSSCRIELTKTIAILLVIDDIFDSYGTLTDLLLFTDAIRRWDLGAMEQLPEYMKICYMALYNTTNEIAYKVLKEHGLSIVSHLQRTWVDAFEAFLVEAKWFNRGYIPSIEEHLGNAVTTGGTYMALVHAFFLMGQGVTKETIAMLEPYPKLFTHSGKVLRLWDDLGTAKEEQEKGDVASSIQCHMRDKTMSSEEEARKHIRQLIRNLWVELNYELIYPTDLPLSIITASFDLSRTAQVVYQHGDDSKVSSVEDHVEALLFRPIGNTVDSSNLFHNVAKLPMLQL